jgi:flagellar assembly protein FliH
MSRVIPAADVGAVAAWGPPTVEGQAGTRRHSGGGPVTAGVLADLQAEAYAEAFQQGLREGTAAGREQVRAQVERLDQLLTDLARPLAEVDEAVQGELLSLAMALARQIVRRELRQDPTQIIGIVREAMAQLPVAARDVRVQLHPEDAAIVREHLAPAENERAWLLVEDPMMMRGGCQVVSASSRIDVRLDKRLGALLSELMGSERDPDARPNERS